jgi:hypothetical protein
VCEEVTAMLKLGNTTNDINSSDSNLNKVVLYVKGIQGQEDGSEI